MPPEERGVNPQIQTADVVVGILATIGVVVLIVIFIVVFRKVMRG